MRLYSFVSNQTTQIVEGYQTEKDMPFGEYIGNDYFDFKILLNDEQDIEELRGQEFSFVINNTDKNLIHSFKGAMEIAPAYNKSTIA